MNRSASRIPKAVIFLGIVSFLTDAASEMIYPLVPVYVTALGSGAVVLGFIEGIAETTSSVLKLVSGILSDRLGKRKILVLAGYSISSIVRPLTGLVATAWQIVPVRMADRIGKGIRSAPRDALIASSVSRDIRGKSFGFHRAMDHAGAVAGPVLAIMSLMFLVLVAGLDDPLMALRMTFLLSILPGALAVLTIIFFVREAAPAVKKREAFSLSLKNYDSNFRNYLLIMILFTLGNSSDAFLLFRLQETIQESRTLIDFVSKSDVLASVFNSFEDSTTRESIINILFLPFIWAFFHIIKVVFSTPLGSLSDSIGRKTVIITGWAIYIIVYAGFSLISFMPPDTRIPASFVLFAVYALYYAFTEGAEKAFVADLVQDENRGTAYGLFNFSVGLGALPASIIFGILYSYFDKLFPGYGGTVAFGSGATLAMISIILLAFKVKESGKIRD